MADDSSAVKSELSNHQAAELDNTQGASDTKQNIRWMDVLEKGKVKNKWTVRAVETVSFKKSKTRRQVQHGSADN